MAEFETACQNGRRAGCCHPRGPSSTGGPLNMPRAHADTSSMRDMTCLTGLRQAKTASLSPNGSIVRES